MARNFLHELRDVRNRHAHMERFDDRDVERAIDTLDAFSKPSSLLKS
jgi:putative aminopeptidase FrvX